MKFAGLRQLAVQNTDGTMQRWKILVERKIKAEYRPRVHLLKVIDSSPLSALTESFDSQACSK